MDTRYLLEVYPITPVDRAIRQQLIGSVVKAFVYHCLSPFLPTKCEGLHSNNISFLQRLKVLSFLIKVSLHLLLAADEFPLFPLYILIWIQECSSRRE